MHASGRVVASGSLIALRDVEFRYPGHEDGPAVLRRETRG
jgi:hypothetical protein